MSKILGQFGLISHFPLNPRVHVRVQSPKTSGEIQKSEEAPPLTGAVDAAGPYPLVVVVGPHDAVEDLLLLLAVVDLLLRARTVTVVEHAPASEKVRK